MGATTSILSDKSIYPYFSRIEQANNGQIKSLTAILEYYADLEGPIWRELGILCTALEYGIDLSQSFIEETEDIFDIVSYHNYLQGESADVELRELERSGVRVIIGFIVNADWDEIIVNADNYGLVNENYVWFTGNLVGLINGFTDEEAEVRRLTQGAISTVTYIPETNALQEMFDERWYQLDPAEYPTNSAPPTNANLIGYDFFTAAAMAVDKVDKLGYLDAGERIDGSIWAQNLRNVSFEGLTGTVIFNEKGDRVSTFSINYFDSASNAWIRAALYSPIDGLEMIRDVVWFSNTTEIPDLDIRPPFNYWSCHDKEEKTDPTGKTVKLYSPDNSDINNIASEYYCDQFIDCKNLSDESTDCYSNYLVVFIVFGIIIGILILVCIGLLIFVIVFGVILRYRRLRTVSPTILVLLLISIIVGYSSLYAWFGKPHPVACGFQPWLLGLASIGMISSLCVKVFRIWRLFRKSMTRLYISDLQLLLLWCILMTPVVIILVVWTIVSTPTAKLKDFDDTDHYVCTTGGFTGEPGGIIFFFILVGYGFLVLFAGIFLSIVTRNVPSQFNESKLLAISIYNLGFLSVIIIPVFMVVQPYNPFIAWILRTVAILYAFTATLTLQFVPPFFGILLFDKCKNIKVFVPTHTQNQSFNLGGASQSGVNTSGETVSVSSTE